jgi:hypothetical protein
LGQLTSMDSVLKEGGDNASRVADYRFCRSFSHGKANRQASMRASKNRPRQSLTNKSISALAPVKYRKVAIQIEADPVGPRVSWLMFAAAQTPLGREKTVATVLLVFWRPAARR